MLINGVAGELTVPFAHRSSEEGGKGGTHLKKETSLWLDAIDVVHVKALR
jgi:hypothetical protein